MHHKLFDSYSIWQQTWSKGKFIQKRISIFTCKKVQTTMCAKSALRSEISLPIKRSTTPKVPLPLAYIHELTMNLPLPSISSSRQGGGLCKGPRRLSRRSENSRKRFDNFSPPWVNFRCSSLIPLWQPVWASEDPRSVSRTRCNVFVGFPAACSQQSP